MGLKKKNYCDILYMYIHIYGFIVITLVFCGLVKGSRILGYSVLEKYLCMYHLELSHFFYVII